MRWKWQATKDATGILFCTRNDYDCMLLFCFCTFFPSLSAFSEVEEVSTFSHNSNSVTITHPIKSDGQCTKHIHMTWPWFFWCGGGVES